MVFEDSTSSIISALARRYHSEASGSAKMAEDHRCRHGILMLGYQGMLEIGLTEMHYSTLYISSSLS